MILMQGRLAIVIMSVFLCLQGFSQEITARKILSDSLKSCDEIQYASMQLIPLYYQAGIFDTANLVVDYWMNHCGIDETIYRTKVLFAIDAGTFTDTLVSDATIGYLDDYQLLSMDTSGTSLDRYYYYTPEFPLLKWYQAFTDSIAKRASGYIDLSDEERFFIDFYLHPDDSLYTRLASEPLKTSRLGKIYNQPIYGGSGDLQLHYALTGGIWIPDDKLVKIGNHPSIGAYAGLRKKRMILNIGLAFRVGSSPNTITTLFLDSLYETKEFTGINVMLEAGRQVVQWHRHEVDLVGGVDFEMMDILNITESDGNGGESTNSRNLYSPSVHVGLGYKYYTKNRHYFGISSKYSVLNFNNKGGTNLRGNALSINLEYGFGTNDWLNRKNTYLNQRIPSVTP